MDFLVINFLFVLMDEILTPGIIVINFDTSINFNGKHYFSLEGVFSFYHYPLMQWKQRKSWIHQFLFSCFKFMYLWRAKELNIWHSYPKSRCLRTNNLGYLMLSSGKAGIQIQFYSDLTVTLQCLSRQAGEKLKIQ